MKHIALFISCLFHPVLIPIIVLILVMYTPTDLDFITLTNSLFFLDETVKKLFLNSFALFCSVFPAISTIVLKMTRQNTPFDFFPIRYQRFAFFLTAIYALMLVVVLLRFNTQLPISFHLFALIGSYGVLALLFAGIHFFLKLSIYPTGLGLLLGFTFAYYADQAPLVLLPLYTICCLVGLATWSYMVVKKITLSESLWAIGIGFSITFALDKCLGLLL